MKKMIAMIAIIGTPSIYAQQIKFGDINYFLKEGQFNVMADASTTYYKETTQNADTLETRGSLLETQFGYGINDQLNLYIGLDYAFNNIVENKKTTANSDFSQNGLANPMISGNYRLMNQKDSLLNLDFGAVAKVNVQDAESGESLGNSSENGNYANGRSSMELNARIGRKWDEANEWQLAGGLIYNHDGEKTNLSTDGNHENVDVDSSTDFFVKASYQYSPIDEFLLSLSAKATRLSEIDSKSATFSSTDKSHYDMDFVFRAKYLITDTFIANFHYGMSRNENYDRDFNGSDIEIKKRRENYFGVGIDLLF
jgi:hypothetical protein